jgi:hypothetical protein
MTKRKSKTKKGKVILTSKGFDITVAKHPHSALVLGGKVKITHKKDPYAHWGNVYNA